MKEFSHSQIKDIYEKRIKKVVDYLIENSIGAAVFIDNESHPRRAQEIPQRQGLRQQSVAIRFHRAILHDGDPACYGAPHGLQQTEAAFHRLVCYEIEVKVQILAHPKSGVEK